MDMKQSENVEYKHNLYKEIIPDTERRKISERFEVLAQRENNWDSYDSKKPTALILKRAQDIIENMLDIVSSESLWFTPFISSDEDGYITAAWYNGERELHLEIDENEVEYTKVWGDNVDMKMEIDYLNSDNCLVLWKWLLNG